MKRAGCRGSVVPGGRGLKSFVYCSENLNVKVQRMLFALAFVCMCSGAWAQKNVYSESGESVAAALKLEVQGVEDASLSAIPVERTSPNGKQLYCAYDIDIYKDGREWQPEPEQPAMVSMENPDFADGQLLDIYHEGADGLEFVATVASENGKITFPAHSFSVYIVAQAPEYNRLKVILHRADNSTKTIYVKKLDITQGNYNQIVYNPGMGTPAAGVKCMGWTTNAGYGAADVASAMTYDDVRAAITDSLNAGVADGDEIHFYTMLFKSRSVTYLDHNGAVLQTDQLLFRENEDISRVEYTVDAAYTTDDSHKFEGWELNPHHNTGVNIMGHDENANNYTNDSLITITGDVVFDVNIIEGNWLVFHENGKGGTYNAPQFVLSGHTTQAPSLSMQRYGYTFGGWYTDSLCSPGSEFSFGGTIAGRTNIYAKWTPKAKAPYMIIMWTQNLSRTGYEVKASYVNETGTVGEPIPYESVDNGDEDYARHRATFGNGALSTNTGDRSYEEVLGHYRGFCLTERSKNQRVTITPEGDAVLNLYYDRIEYNFKFYLYRNAGSNKYDYANNSGSGSSLSDLVSWHSNQTEHPGVANGSGYTIQSETVGGKTYYYFAIHAYYGEDISSKWPTYSQITGANGRDPVSFVMMVGTKLKPNATTSGSGTVKGIVSVLNSNILGATNNSNGNYVVIRFPGGTVNNWRYHIWFETIEGEDYSGRNTHEYNGKTYYEESVMEVRSSNTQISSQNEPKYNGFTFIGKKNQDWSRENFWTSGSNPTLYHMNFVYNREQYKINYFDGKYTNGNNGQIQNKSGNMLHESSLMGQGAALAAEDTTYIPELPEGESGYIFEGWYLDEGCTTPYTWSTMPVGGITVYAKWRQIQYRVFLHPNVDPADRSLDWGSNTQTMCFRIDYGGKISVPKGIRDDYEQVGWYTDEACTQVFNPDLVLNERTATTEYDKTTVFTDYMNKWGLIRTDTLPPCNTDLTGNYGSERFWITSKFDLYAKWRAKLRGADGITVIYNGGEGSPAIDTAKFLYQDNVSVVAREACTHPNENFKFSHWVLQNWNGREFEDTHTKVYPGTTFVVHKSNSKMAIWQWYDPEHPENIWSGEIRDSSSLVCPANPYREYRAYYTVRLRAEYEKVDEPEYTFIKWFNNYGGTSAINGNANAPHNLAINDAVLPPVPTRTGYTFKGWYKHNVTSGTPPTTISECAPNFLYYNNGRYYKEEACTNVVTKVAADLYEATDYLYAVWKPEVEFTLASNVCQGNPLPLPTTTDGNVVLEGSWSAPAGGTIEGSYYTAASVTSTTLTFTPSTSSYPSKCASAKDFDVSFLTPDASLSSYDYIWKGGAASPADWNTTSNWYVYESGYKIATTLPAIDKNIYIGPSQCVTANWPSQSGEANAHDITIASNASLTVPAGKTLNIAGDLINTGTLNANNVSGANNSKVVFCGTGNQSISRAQTFREVEFAQTNTDESIYKISVPNGITVSGAATFTKGIVDGDAIFENGSRVTNAVADMTRASFIDGLVTKKGNGEFTFPTGGDGVLGAFNVTLAGNSSDVNIRFNHKRGEGDDQTGFSISEFPRWWNIADMCNSNEPQLDHVSNFEYWMVDGLATNTTMSTLTLKVDADALTEHFHNPSSYDSNKIYAAAHYACWKNLGRTNVTVSGDRKTITIEGISSIPTTLSRATDGGTFDGIVTLGSTDDNTVLPIELAAFGATCDGNFSILEWTTASERNNDYFSLERSDDAINFTEVARIAGAGNSIEPLSYSYTDYGVRGGDNYYRLVQVDYDGTRTASEIIVTNCVEASGEPEVLAYPNPFNGDLTVELENFGNQPARIDVYDVLGRIVYTEDVDAPHNNYQTVLHLGDLPKATYMVRVGTEEFVINLKVVKNE